MLESLLPQIMVSYQLHQIEDLTRKMVLPRLPKAKRKNEKYCFKELLFPKMNIALYMILYLIELLIDLNCIIKTIIMRFGLTRQQPREIETQLSIEKALEFVGDNSTYQKRRLLILSIIILSIAILTCKLPLESSQLTMMFLIASGAGQILCPIYMSLKTCTLGLAGFALFASAFYPVNFSYLGLGFFGRGFFACSLIYVNEIGGARFKAWSMIVVFGVWGISSLISSVTRIVQMPSWFWSYGLIFFPILVDSYFVLKYWEPSPFRLYTKNLFNEATIILNKMAVENERPTIPYKLQGEVQGQSVKFIKHSYYNIFTRPIIRKITIPLLIVWIYRQYIYYCSFLMIPQLGDNYSRNYTILSISEIVAVLTSYPINLNIKRVNVFFFCAIIIFIFSSISSFTTLGAECMLAHSICASKYIYQISIFMIRFSSSLIGIILVSYTLEIYPSNIRSMGFSFCLAISSFGSILMPWINQLFIYVNLSGFISFSVASMVVFYFINKLNQTYGKMRTQTLEALQQNSPSISLQSWATLNF